MAYQPYPYPSYQPTPYYPQAVPDQLAQLRQNQMRPPMMQAAPQGGGINWMNSKQEADNWTIAPGCAVALWDSNSPVIYLRQADSIGKPSTKVYDLVERMDNPPAQTAPQIDLSQYVTIDQLESILAERLKKPAKGIFFEDDNMEHMAFSVIGRWGKEGSTTIRISELETVPNRYFKPAEQQIHEQ